MIKQPNPQQDQYNPSASSSLHLIPTPHLSTSNASSIRLILPTPHSSASNTSFLRLILPIPHSSASSSLYLIPPPHPPYTSLLRLIPAPPMPHPYTLSPHLIPLPHPCASNASFLCLILYTSTSSCSSASSCTSLVPYPVALCTTASYYVSTMCYCLFTHLI